MNCLLKALAMSLGLMCVFFLECYGVGCPAVVVVCGCSAVKASSVSCVNLSQSAFL